MTKTYRSVLMGASATLALAVATPALAGSFAIKERSTIAQGLSFAGVTAGSGGIESMGFNPAAIGLVDDLELSGGLSIISPSSSGDVTVNGTATGETVDPGRLAGLANNYVGYRMEPDILIGLAVYTPFGLTTEYPDASTVAADAVTSKLQTIVFAPTVAWQPMENLTLGGSLNLAYVDARLTSTAATVEGNGGFEVGYGLGVLWEPTSSTKVGLAYQSGYDLNINGDISFNGTALPPGLPATARAELPGVVSAGIVQGITDDLRIMGEVQWQNWSVFDEIVISAPGVPLIGDFEQIDEQNYDDAFYVAVGGEYDFTDDLTLRMGAAWDQTPTNDDFLAGQINSVNATNRTARIPDADRIWLSIGGSYDVDEHMTLSAGYSYLFTMDEATVGLRNAAPGTEVNFDASVHIFSVGGSLKF